MLTWGTVQFGGKFAIGTLEQPTWFHTMAGLVVYIAALLGVFSLVQLLAKDWRTAKPKTGTGQEMR